MNKNDELLKRHLLYKQVGIYDKFGTAVLDEDEGWDEDPYVIFANDIPIYDMRKRGKSFVNRP